MTMRRSFWPECDKCGLEDESYSDPHASEAKFRMKRDGWKVRDRFICPACNGKDPGYWEDVY